MPKITRSRRMDTWPKSGLPKCANPNSITISVGTQTLGLKIYKQLAKNHDDFVFSPYSLYEMFGIFEALSPRQVARDIRKTFEYPFSGESLHRAFGETRNQLPLSRLNPRPTRFSMKPLLRKLPFWSKRRSGLEDDTILPRGDILTIPHGYWTQDDLSRHDARRILTRYYDACLEHADFQLYPDQARARINQWVEEMTRGNIPELFKPGNIRSDTRSVFVSGIHFHGDWLTPFDVDKTKKAPFEWSSGKFDDVDTMFLKEPVYYFENEDCQAVGLPYQDEGTMLLALLPTRRFQLAPLMEHFHSHAFVRILEDMKLGEIEVQFPKFTLDQRLDIQATLQGIGLYSPFESGQGCSSQEMENHSRIDVNETGTTFSSFSAKIGIMGPTRKRRFIADQPFMFAILDTYTAIPLAMGRVTHPVYS